MVQLREKLAADDEYVRRGRALVELCHARNVPMVVNDRFHLVEKIGADGLHLGQEDLTTAEARSALGKDYFIGRSTHSLSQATMAAEERPDYIAFGPVFSTATKTGQHQTGLGLRAIEEVCSTTDAPVVAIGGIDPGNVGDVVRAGAAGSAVVSAIADAPDPQNAARDMVAAMRGAVSGK